jgi:uncharacterized membrane protein YhaH (DUF805 family)
VIFTLQSFNPIFQKKMNFIASIKTCFSKYADFNGRATRSEYWWFALFFTIVLTVGAVVDEYGMVVALLVLLIPITSVTTRRLHDTGRSGWMQLLNLIPLGNFYVLYLLIKPSDAGSNRF